MVRNTAAEKGVLAGLLQYGADAYSDVSDLLPKAEAFTLDGNESIYRCIQYIFAENHEAKIDLHAILTAANTIGVTADIQSDTTYLQRLFTTHIEIENVRPLAKKVRKLAAVREIVQTYDLSKQEMNDITGDEPMTEIVAKAANPILRLIDEITSHNAMGVRNISDGLREWVQHLRDNPSETVGISTGWARYDKAIGGGIRRKTVHIIGARTGIGKTWIGSKVAMHTSGQLKIKTLYLDSEMEIEGQWPRLLAALLSNGKGTTHAPITISDIETGKFAENDYKNTRVSKAVEAYEKLGNLFQYVNISGKDFEEVLAIMRRWVIREVGFNSDGTTKDCMIVYDYLKLTSSDSLKELQEYQLLGIKTGKLHDFCVQYDVPCLTFAQLNRDGIDNETTAAIGASDRIAHLGSSVCIYKVKSPTEIEHDGVESGNRKLIPVKVRFGAGLADGDYINYMFNGEIGMLKELKTRNELKNERPPHPPGEAEQD